MDALRTARLALALSTLLALAASAQETRPARPDRRKPDPIAEAVRELTKEAQPFVRRGGALPRTECDYFKGNPVAIEQADLAKALRRQQSASPVVDAYVKWQLLSAVEPAFDEANFAKAFDAYVASPSLLPPPGLGEVEQRELDNQARKVHDADEIAEHNRRWAASLAQTALANGVIVRYRDELVRRTSASAADEGKLLRARVEDLWTRAANGVDVAAGQKALFADVRDWSGRQPRAEVERMVGFLNEYARRTPPERYEQMVWKAKKAQWKRVPAGLEAGDVEKLMADLRDDLAAKPR